MKRTSKNLIGTLIASALMALPTQAQVPGAAAPKGPTAQEVVDLAAKHFNAQNSNRDVIKGYSWQYRTEVWKEGTLLWIDMMNANLNAEGKPVLTQINREQIVEDRHGLFSRRKQEKQTKEFEQVDAIIRYVVDWVTFYNRMPLASYVALFEKSLGLGGFSTAHSSGDLLRVSAKNVRGPKANDSMELWLNRKSGHPVQFSFTVPVQKSLEGGTGETISATIHYRYLRDGSAFYPDHMNIVIPSRTMKIKIEHLNMMKKL